MTEEIFGPLLPVLKFNDLGQVIKHIKGNEKPLTVYIFARNRRMIDRLAQQRVDRLNVFQCLLLKQFF